MINILNNLLFTNDIRVDKAKIVDYLLAPSHPEGWSKARFFRDLGFSVESWQELASALKKVGLVNPVTDTVESVYGWRYVVDGQLISSSGRQAYVRTVWFIEKLPGGSAESPRLITAYPL